MLGEPAQRHRMTNAIHAMEPVWIYAVVQDAFRRHVADEHQEPVQELLVPLVRASIPTDDVGPWS